MWETSAIEIWGTTRDLGFPVSKDKDLVRSARDAVEDRRINLVISPEILSFCRRKIEERDQEEEPDLCTRAVQELVNQWSPGCNAGDLAQTEDAFEGHLLSRKLGWCPMKNQWVTRCLGGAEGPLDRQETVGRGKRWEATSTPLQWYDPEPLPSVPGTPQVGRDFYLDEPCTARGFVSVAPTSLAWKDRAGKFDIKLTQGVATSLHAQYSWTVPSGAWTHRRALFRGDPEELVRLFHRDRVRQERLEKAGHRSPKWEVLRSLQQVYGARKVRDCTIIDAPPFFESAGREEREPREKIDGEDEGSPPPRDSEATTTTVFWGDDEGPVVMVWDGMTQEEQVIAQTVISGEKDWVIWRTKPTQSKPGENAAGDRIYQEATVFLEEFGTKLEGAMPRGSKSQKRSENGSGGGFTRRKDWYRLNDIRTAACGRDMEIWVPKSGSVPVPDRIEAVWEAWRRDSPKDECTVKLEGPEKEWWAGTELGLLRAYHFPGHVTASDGSVGSDCMGAGFTWMDSSLKRCGSERIGRDEEGTSSGRAELGGYAAILKRTPDTQDLVTATDSEVLCRLVRRWIGQGGKASLSNTADADILEFIIGKLRARIAANARTFLVKIKAHRGEPLNERADDLADEGKTLAKAGDSYPWTNRTTRLVYSYYDRATHQWKKGTWSKTIRNAARRGAAESLMEDRLQKGADKWRTELFKSRHEFWEGEQIEPVCPSEKWETVASGQWMQKSAWNRMVTRTMREQPHTTPVTTTWTADFLTRECEGRKAMGDWLHDKLIPWKARRRLLQTNSGTFPCESRLQKWGKHSDGICGLCKRCREMGLGLLGGKPARGTTGHLQSSACRLQAPAATGAHNQCFQQVQEDMSKARSTCKDWDFVSKGTEISVGRFLIEYFTPVTLGEQHQGALSDEDVAEVWLAAKSEAISKARRTKGGAKGAEAHCPDVKEVEKTFWLSRPDGWVINKKTKRIIMLEFKRASDTAETYYSDMKSIAERQPTPILEGLNALAGERGWVVEVLPLVAGQRSVREKEWLEAMKTFGTSAEDGKRIIYRLGSLLLSEHEKLFGSYWRQVFGPPSSLMHLLGKGLAVRASNSI